MKVIFESEYQTILYSAEDSLVITRWKDATKDMSDDCHLSEIHPLYMVVRRKSPSKFLSDATRLKYHLTEEAQNFASNLFKENAASFIAIVTSEETKKLEIIGLFDQFRQVVNNEIILRYYTDYDAALNWLINV